MRKVRFFGLLGLVLLLTCCGQARQNTPARIGAFLSAIPTPTSAPEPSPTPTLTLTPSPTITPTPTPTAQPLSVSGDVRAGRLTTPEAQPGAPCGVVDILDFPLDPPDALAALGGQDFGVYREVFGGRHAGEDWWRYPTANANFGAPVYSIGHGQVTYAAPNGWGVDKGVLVVRHIFPDGGQRYSFYGHLDPPSVVLRAGDCVARGDLVGEIGKPRGAPHLHFEIRTHMPDRPGPGYSSRDPELGGWEPPSQFIWDQRLATSQGVVWTHSDFDASWLSLGALRDGTFCIKDTEQLVALNVSDGSVRWSQTISTSTFSAAVNAQGSIVYISGRGGALYALSVPEAPEDVGDESPLDSEHPLLPLWSIRLDARGTATLLPLPEIGVAVFVGRRMFGVSATGEVMWEHEPLWFPDFWALDRDVLVVSPRSRDIRLWTLAESGAVPWDVEISGRPAFIGDEIWLYADSGVYRLNEEDLTVERVFLLPVGLARYGDIVALPGGGALLAHWDYSDKRLIALNADGSLRWQRSYAGVLQGRLHLWAFGDRVYLASQEDSDYALSEVKLFALDAETAELTHVFTGATRRPATTLTAIHPVNDHRLLINLGGLSLTLFDFEQLSGAYPGE